MRESLSLGIDLGKRLSVAVVDEDGRPVATPATEYAGPLALESVLDRIETDGIDRVMVTRAVGCQGLPTHLEKVGVLRIAAPANTSIPAFSGWPGSLVHHLVGWAAIVAGGHHFDGSPRCPLDRDAVHRFAHECLDREIRAIAIVGTNSSSAPEHEQQAAEIVTEILGPRAHIVFGNTMQGIGIIERENTAALEAAYVRLVSNQVQEISNQLSRRGIDVEMHVGAGTGTLMSMAELIAHPLRAYQSDLASLLTGVVAQFAQDDMIVVDSRGDVGRVFTVTGGIPNQIHAGESIHGVRTVVSRLMEATLVGGEAAHRASECVERTRLWMGDVPAVRLYSSAGGNGVGDPIASVTDVVMEDWAAAAGAAVAQVGGFADKAFNFADSTYDEAVTTAKTEAIDAAVRAGADPLRTGVARFTATPLNYVASRRVRLSATAIGPLL